MRIYDVLKWSTDLSSPPADTRVLLAYTEDGARKVCVSRWLPPAWDRPTGRWVGFVASPTKSVPYAWAPWPEAPEER